MTQKYEINEIFVPISSELINDESTQVVSVKQTVEEVIEDKLNNTKQGITSFLILGTIFILHIGLYLIYKNYISDYV